jgi:hypothetical protein
MKDENRHSPLMSPALALPFWGKGIVHGSANRVKQQLFTQPGRSPRRLPPIKERLT